jgi:hypothetical protein
MSHHTCQTVLAHGDIAQDFDLGRYTTAVNG